MHSSWSMFFAGAGGYVAEHHDFSVSVSRLHRFNRQWELGVGLFLLWMNNSQSDVQNNVIVLLDVWFHI